MSPTVKVGIFMTAALLLLGWLILRVEDLALFQPPGQRVEAVFDSVAGLDDKSSIRVAGVRVGRVDGIRLEGQRAVVTLLLEQPVPLTTGAAATIANLGLLGDKYVILDPGPEGGEPLAAGARLPGTTPVGFDEAMAKVNELGESLQTVVGSLADGEDSTLEALPRLLDSLERTSNEIGALVAANRRQVTATVDHLARFSGTLADELPRLTQQMGRVLEQVEAVVAENRDQFRDGLGLVREAAAGVRTSIDNLNEITGTIASGEGTIGKLVSSDEAHDSLVAALGSVEEGVATLTDTVGRVQKLQLELGFDSYNLDELDDFRNAFSIRLTPRPSRFYQLELVDDPRGKVRTRTDVTTTTLPDGAVETTTVRRVTTEDDLTLSAQVGFRLGDARVRAGVFESAGGAGLDYGLFDERLWLSLEAFDFGREEDLDPRLRLTGRFRLHPNFHLLAGYDDFLESDRSSLFFGGGLSWTDDDLKYLLGSLPLAGGL